MYGQRNNDRSRIDDKIRATDKASTSIRHITDKVERRLDNTEKGKIIVCREE